MPRYRVKFRQTVYYTAYEEEEATVVIEAKDREELDEVISEIQECTYEPLSPYWDCVKTWDGDGDSNGIDHEVLEDAGDEEPNILAAEIL